ncbi:MAG: type II toxin-antitoxin system RelE/ParE family toxin [Deltaproteobacteria bacterium]|nr:type II toxin-antitoxin system RelE/ParE family toxin [Deltaproteobacteria bacterium]
MAGEPGHGSRTAPARAAEELKAPKRVRTYRFTETAARDLEHITQWLTQPGSGPRAHERLRRLSRAIRALVDAPCQWPPGEHSGTRELPCEGHRVIYRIDPDTGDNTTAGTITVLRVFGPGQARSL